MSEPVKPQPILCVRGLKKSYPILRTDATLVSRAVGKALNWTGRLDEWRPLYDGLPILKGVDLDVYPNESLAIVGHSGAGKSTLLHLMGALDPPSDGAIIYRGQDIFSLGQAGLADYRNKRIGFVFQFYYLFPDLTALENVFVPGLVASSVFGWYGGAKAKYEERARELLRRVGLEKRADHRPAQLSGGEQQRVAIARALLLEPELLLCDEPTGNLDRKTGEGILELLWELKAKTGQTYVMVTHDRAVAARADRCVEMEDGKLKESLGLEAPPAGAAVGPAPHPKEPARDLVSLDAKLVSAASPGAPGKRPLVPAWALVFMVACAAIALTGQTLLPLSLALAGVFICGAVSREWHWNLMTRVVLTAAVTLGAWLGVVLAWSYLHPVR